MGVRYDGLVTAHEPGAAIAAYRLVKHGSVDGEVVQAAGTDAAIIGVCTRVPAAADDPVVEVVRSGIAEVMFGGPVARGEMVTSDADGKGVKAAPSAQAQAFVVGIAEVSGVDGDIGSVMLCPSQTGA